MALRTEWLVIALLAVAFYVTAFGFASHPWHILVPGTICFPSAWGVARLLGKEEGSGTEMIAVFLVAALAIALPAADSPPLNAATVVGIGLAILTAEAIWAVERFPPRPVQHQSLIQALRDTLPIGFGAAFLYSLWASAVIGVAALASAEVRAEVGHILPPLALAYFAGGLLAAVAVSACRRLTGSPLGTMLVGLIAGIVIYGAMAPVVALIEAAKGDPMTLTDQALVAIACGTLVGPPGALALQYD